MGGNSPLELRCIPITKNGLNKGAPALHRMWAVRRSWANYSSPPFGLSIEVPGAKDTWLLQARRVESDLSWLLHLPCHKFWSQLLHDEELLKCLEGILQSFPRQHDVSVEQRDDELVSKNFRILNKLFLVFVRLCTYKESATDFMTPDYFGNLIYDKFLLDIPKLMDICVLFGPCNKVIVSKMVANVIKCQPKYLEDLISTGDTLGQAFESVSERLQVIQMAIPSNETCENLLDLVYYLIDICHTLSSFLELCSSAATPLHATGLECKVANLYQGALVEISVLLSKFHSQGYITEVVFRRLMISVKMARHCLIKVFRSIVNHCCLSPALEGECVDPLAENYLHIMTTSLSERNFLVDYDKMFPLHDDFEMFSQAGANIDNTRKHYILDGIVAPVLQPTKNSLGKNETQSKTIEPEPMKSSASNNVKSNGPSGVELASLISTVRDLLPYLGEGFVEKCLSHFDWKVDDVVNSLLEANLPPHLAEMDQSEGRTVEVAPVEPPRSVYEADEFDVNTWDNVDVSKVHRGKRKKGKDANSMLEDKSVINSMRERYSELGIIDEVEVLVGEAAGNDYDDEYDDTYDDNPVGPDEVDEHIERRPFVLPRALGGGHIGRTVVIDSEEEDDEEDEKKKEFVRNPEDVRAEADRRFQHKMSRGRGGRAPPNRDVVGKEKGQGQDKQVLINRSRKTANKGKAQRSGADRKQAKGMF